MRDLNFNVYTGKGQGVTLRDLNFNIYTGKGKGYIARFEIVTSIQVKVQVKVLPCEILNCNVYTGKCKGKFRPRKGHEGQEGE